MKQIVLILCSCFGILTLQGSGVNNAFKEIVKSPEMQSQFNLIKTYRDRQQALDTLLEKIKENSENLTDHQRFILDFFTTSMNGAQKAECMDQGALIMLKNLTKTAEVSEDIFYQAAGADKAFCEAKEDLLDFYAEAFPLGRFDEQYHGYETVGRMLRTLPRRYL